MDEEIKDISLLKNKGVITRKAILDFEDSIKSIEGAFIGDSNECPVKHSFSDGMYVREIFIPMGMVIVGKIHKHDHPNFLMSGSVEVVTEEGTETINAPCSMISKAGTKRTLLALTDLTWVTVHNNPTNTTDLEELEKEVIAKNYKEYNKFISGKQSRFDRLKTYINKKLKL